MVSPTINALMAEIKQGNISEKLAKIEADTNGNEMLYFTSLRKVLPQLRKFCRQADLPTADAKTLGKALRKLGVEYKDTKKFDRSKAVKTWIYQIEDM